MQTHHFFFKGQQLRLHPLKAIYWEEEDALLLADLHLGKAVHFRKAGIPVPRAAGDANWDKLIYLFLEFKPERVLFLGDLFHSTYNSEWQEFAGLIGQFPDIRFELVQGNHDILSPADYEAAQITIYNQPLRIGPFLLSHHPIAAPPEDSYNLAGHIHPCVWLKGNGRQKLKLPCFYFGEDTGLLPAFGAFTGTARIQPQNGDQVFVIAEDAVVEM